MTILEAWNKEKIKNETTRRELLKLIAKYDAVIDDLDFDMQHYSDNLTETEKELKQTYIKIITDIKRIMLK